MSARMKRRSGMTLIEVMIALVILTGALLGMGKFITSFSHATSDGALSSVASDLVLDRLETIKGSTSYATLDAYAVTELAITGFAGYKRVTQVTRTIDGTQDYKAITVTVSNPSLSMPVKKSTIIAAF
jgi:prepilin-type N-terminal cleavage/methylation domain-containing protein